MGWGDKGKSKAVEKALHRAERQEEWAAEWALAHGNIAAAADHWQKAGALASAEEAVHLFRKGTGKGKGKVYKAATEVVVTPASVPVLNGVERTLRHGEQLEQAIAGVALAKGDVLGAAIHASKASELHAAGQAVHREKIGEKVRHARQIEKVEEHLAVRDLAHGNILGAVSHHLHATQAHQKEERLEKKLWQDAGKGGKGKGKVCW